MVKVDAQRVKLTMPKPGALRFIDLDTGEWCQSPEGLECMCGETMIPHFDSLSSRHQLESSRLDELNVRLQGGEIAPPSDTSLRYAILSSELLLVRTGFKVRQEE